MQTQKINQVKQMISTVAGINVDMSIRDKKAFTFHFEGQNAKAMNNIINFFKSSNAMIEGLYDVEIDSTMIFVDVA